MTPEEFTRQLPKLTNNKLSMMPPFVFNGLSARVFPLRANLDTLQQVCDGYLNIVPREAGYFRVTVPYVYLAVLDYGELAEAIMRGGWFSQTEVFFSIPVEWYKLVNGQYVFHDWAVITPYIFVNDQFSVPLGRTVYGFPKILAKVTTTESPWIKNPTAPVVLARIETAVFPEAYSGKGIENRVFLELHKSNVSNFQLPFDQASPMTPWTMASNFARAIGGFSRDAMWLAQSMRIFPVNPVGDPTMVQAMLSRLAPAFAPGGSGLVQNSLNLKQFRRSDRPSEICYQALTNGQMQMTAFNGAGLLGEEHTLLGDLSGGHSVRLYEHSSLPIARILGLDIHRQWTSDQISVVELKPVMPFWIDVDLRYDKGANIAWRTNDNIWKDAGGAPFSPSDQPAGEGEGPSFNSTVTTAIEAIAGPFQFTGAMIRVIPLLADKQKMQEFLNCYLNDSLQSPIVREDGAVDEQVRFEVWARQPQSINLGDPIGGNVAYVYLVASSFDSVTSKTDNVGDWAKYELSFMIPVKWQRKRTVTAQDGLFAPGDYWDTAGVGMVPAYTFVDDCIAAISRIEVQGIEALTANFVRPESVWLSEEGQADPEQTLLRVNAEVFSALGEGQQAAIKPIIEIVRDDPDAGLGAAPDSTWRWAEDLRHELGSKKGAKAQYWNQLKVARALALEILGNQTPVNVYTLKQFRDVTQPDRACYQSLVRVPRVLREVFDVREIEETLAVRIHDYPSLNIVEALGIQASRLEDNSAGILYSAQGIRPFYIRATLDEPLAERLMSRAGTQEWTLHDAAFKTMLSDEPDAPRITVDRLAEKLQDLMDPSRTAETMYQARQRWEAHDVTADDMITAAQARATIDVADPQIMVESVLSREWSNNNPDARWRRGRRALLRDFSALPERGDAKPFAESEFYRWINNQLAAAPGAVASPISLEQILAIANSQPPPLDQFPFPGIPAVAEKTIADTIVNLSGQGPAQRWREEMGKIINNQRTFTELRLAMEHNVDMLSEVAILGVRGVQEAYQAINQARAKQSPPLDPLHVPTARELIAAGDKLIRSMVAIQQMSIVGEPSPHFNLNVQILADYFRLRDMLETLKQELADEIRPGDPPEAEVEVARSHGDEFRQLVDLSRRYCEAQYDALLNKLSRAYQKPDFCVRRDAAGADRDRLLPLTLSWDKDWYYGDVVQLVQTGSLADPSATVTPSESLGGTPPSPAESPRVGGS